VWIDKNVLIGHDTSIGDYSSIMPSTIISGMCNLGRSCTIGAGAIIYQNVNIGKNSLVGIGTNIIKDIKKNSSAINYPRNIIKDIS
jgi:UDP-3-O-[3-hydroxymyristoyl] glucosamine N-acyltransferase